jgi:hypothetical protein
MTRELVQQIVGEANTMGIPVMIIETYRSQERQQQLFAQYATQLERVGVHHFGLACDIVKSIGGEPSWKEDFSFLGELARKHGLLWGGDWGDPHIPHNFVDLVHVQRCALADQEALFRGDWYPDENYLAVPMVLDTPVQSPDSGLLAGEPGDQALSSAGTA